MMVTALLFDLPLGWSVSSAPNTHLNTGEPIDYKTGSPVTHDESKRKVLL